MTKTSSRHGYENFGRIVAWVASKAPTQLALDGENRFIEGEANALATEAAKELGIKVSIENLKIALKSNNLELRATKSKRYAHHDRSSIIAGELVKVMEHSGLTPAKELKAIASKRAVVA